jgi:ADP-ribose pyrophosphatase YjhB (NUDIX family)
MKNAAHRHSNIPSSYLILIRENKILLSLRCNTGFEDGKYSLVAGHCEEGETFTQCLIREAKEEVGIELLAGDIQVAHVMHRNSYTPIDNERVDVFFTAKKWTGTLENKEPDKCDDLAWFDLDNLPRNTILYICQAIEMIEAGTFYSEHGWNSEQKSSIIERAF